MNITSAARTLGRIGGQSTSDAKRAASRNNGALGGRPLSYNSRITSERIANDKSRARIAEYVSEHSTRDFDYGDHDQEIAAIEDWLGAGDYRDRPSLSRIVCEWNAYPS